jgi:hypothetical protein
MKNTYLLLFLCLTSISVSAQDVLLLKSTGKVIIGDTSEITTPANYGLYVQHGILTEKVKVSLHTTGDWSDDAWDRTPSLSEVEQSIENSQHLVNMPSAASLVETGYDVTEMDSKLLEQIEWLWQHMIALEQENAALRAKVTQLAEDHD